MSSMREKPGNEEQGVNMIELQRELQMQEVKIEELQKQIDEYENQNEMLRN